MTGKQGHRISYDSMCVNCGRRKSACRIMECDGHQWKLQTPKPNGQGLYGPCVNCGVEWRNPGRCSGSTTVEGKDDEEEGSAGALV